MSTPSQKWTAAPENGLEERDPTFGPYDYPAWQRGYIPSLKEWQRIFSRKVDAGSGGSGSSVPGDVLTDITVTEAPGANDAVEITLTTTREDGLQKTESFQVSGQFWDSMLAGISLTQEGQALPSTRSRPCRSADVRLMAGTEDIPADTYLQTRRYAYGDTTPLALLRTDLELALDQMALTFSRRRRQDQALLLGRVHRLEQKLKGATA